MAQTICNYVKMKKKKGSQSFVFTKHKTAKLEYIHKPKLFVT